MKNNYSVLLSAGLLGFLIVVAFSIVPVRAEDGRAIAVLGDVERQRVQDLLQLKRGMAVNQGDIVRTGAGAAAQLRMIDESILAIRQLSEVEISTYRFDKDNPGGGTASISLRQGGLRTVIGKIGTHAPRNYEVKTVAATIGIRGTHFRLQLCDETCAESEPDAREGLYGGVTEGRIAVVNDSGVMEFGADEYFFVDDFFSVPKLLPAAPDLLNDRLESLAAARRNGGDDASDHDSETVPPAFFSDTSAMQILSGDQLQGLALQQLRPVEGDVNPSKLATVKPIDDDFVPIGAAGDIRGQIVWMTNADIDLHLLAPTGENVYFSSPRAMLGDNATAALDHDNKGDIIDIAPDKRVENIVVTGTEIPLGDYRFFAHNYSGNNNGLPTNVQIRVTGDGNGTSRSDTVTLQDRQYSDNYVVEFRGINLSPRYRVDPR